MLRLLCLMMLLSGAVASEAIDRVLATWDADAAKARDAKEATTNRALDKASKSLEATATAAAKKGDIATAATTWKALLTLNPDHPKAREFFSATGNLEAVLKEVTQPTDSLGNPVAQPDLTTMPADAQVKSIGSTPGQELSLGPLKTGSTVMLQYVQGVWNPRVGLGPLSPDQAQAPASYRLVLLDGITNTVIATVPPDTVNKPFSIMITQSVSNALLTIAPPSNNNFFGSVSYKVAVLP